jgi:hypothetical protein
MYFLWLWYSQALPSEQVSLKLKVMFLFLQACKNTQTKILGYFNLELASLALNKPA